MGRTFSRWTAPFSMAAMVAAAVQAFTLARPEITPRFPDVSPVFTDYPRTSRRGKYRRSMKAKAYFHKHKKPFGQ